MEVDRGKAKGREGGVARGGYIVIGTFTIYISDKMDVWGDG